MDVVVVLVLPAWSRALATTMAFSDRLLIRLRRARTPSLSLTVRVLPPETINVFLAITRRPSFSVRLTRQLFSVFGQVTRSVTVPLRKTRSFRGETDTRGATRSTVPTPDPGAEAPDPGAGAPDPGEPGVPPAPAEPPPEPVEPPAVPAADGTITVIWAGLGSVPVAPTARTWKVCGPAARPV